jgi:hypothetical protein
MKNAPTKVSQKAPKRRQKTTKKHHKTLPKRAPKLLGNCVRERPATSRYYWQSALEVRRGAKTCDKSVPEKLPRSAKNHQKSTQKVAIFHAKSHQKYWKITKKTPKNLKKVWPKMSPKCAKNSKKKLICGTCFWHNFRTISAFVWEGLLTPDTLLDAKRVGGIPILGSETQGQANRRAQKSFFEEDNDFWRFFLNFLCFFVPPFYLLFFWLRVFLFIRQKNTKKLFNEKKTKNIPHIFCLKNIAERELLQPMQRTTRTGQSEGSKMTSKMYVKAAKNVSKRRQKTRAKTTKKYRKIAKKHQKLEKKGDPKCRQNAQKTAKENAKQTRKKDVNFDEKSTFLIHSS